MPFNNTWPTGGPQCTVWVRMSCSHPYPHKLEVAITQCLSDEEMVRSKRMGHKLTKDLITASQWEDS